MKRTRLIYKICHIRFRGNFLNSYIVYLDIFQHPFSQHLNAVLWFSKWVTRGVMPVELFQIQKDDAVKVLHSICQQIWKTQQRPQDWKRSVFTPIPKKGNAKEWLQCPLWALLLEAPRTLYFGDFYGGFISRYLLHFQPLFPLWRTDSVF